LNIENYTTMIRVLSRILQRRPTWSDLFGLHKKISQGQVGT